MNETLLYSLQSIISAGAFILLYRLFVRNTNAYNWNRFYLLSTMIISLLLPHIDISQWFTAEKPIIFYAPDLDFNQPVSWTPSQPAQSTFNFTELILLIYWIVAGLLLIRFSWGIGRIVQLIRTSDYQSRGNLKLFSINRKTTFSFFNYLFIQPGHWEKPTIDFIIQHEKAHVRHLHSLDNILTELVLVFGWFNPFYYIYRKDLHLLHECQADRQVINSGCDQTIYRQLLLNEVSGNLTYLIVNQFSYSLIKRRFKMISKNKRSRLAGFRILLAVPMAFALMVLFSFTSIEKTTSMIKDNVLKPTIQVVQSSLNNLQEPQQKPVSGKPPKKKIELTLPLIIADRDTIIENKAAFDSHYPGGYEAWTNFVKQNLNFKLIGTKVKQNGKIEIYVQFTVSENGQIQNPKIIRGMDNDKNNEILRVISMMPNWKPVIKDGKVVPVNYIIPFKMSIQPPKLPLKDSDVDQPEYIGGSDALHQYIRENTHYPEAAKKAKIHGTVWVAAFIDMSGKVDKVKLLKGIGHGCDEEALRVIKNMPDWSPAKKIREGHICRYLSVSFGNSSPKKS